MVQSIEQTPDVALTAEVGAGLGSSLLKLFVSLKASIAAAGKIGRQTRTIVEEELTMTHKLKMCEVSLENDSLTAVDPPTFEATHSKFLRLVGRVSAFNRVTRRH